MDWQEISVRTSPEAVEAVANIFYHLGSGGVIIEDPQLLSKMTNSGQWDAFELPDELLTRTHPVVKGYLPMDEQLISRLEELRAEVGEIAARLQEESYTIILSKVNEEDWANSWKAYFKPLKIGQRVVVRPTWEEYTPGPEEIVLDLDPGMAFGTGTHSTTGMCVCFLERYLTPGMEILDVGTGTGILAMTAARLGAEKVLALDYDPVAVKVAKENIAQNGLTEKIQVRTNDLLQGVGEKADLIVANIVADIIIRLFPQVPNCLKKDGLFLTSGIIGDRKAEVTQVGQELGFTLIDEQWEQDWVAQVWALG